MMVCYEEVVTFCTKIYNEMVVIFCTKIFNEIVAVFTRFFSLNFVCTIYNNTNVNSDYSVFKS